MIYNVRRVIPFFFFFVGFYLKCLSTLESVPIPRCLPGPVVCRPFPVGRVITRSIITSVFVFALHVVPDGVRYGNAGVLTGPQPGHRMVRHRIVSLAVQLVSQVVGRVRVDPLVEPTVPRHGRRHAFDRVICTTRRSWSKNKTYGTRTRKGPQVIFFAGRPNRMTLKIKRLVGKRVYALVRSTKRIETNKKKYIYILTIIPI